MYELVKVYGEPRFVRTVTATLVKAFPLDEENSDYQSYLAWLSEGNEPTVVEEGSGGPVEE